MVETKQPKPTTATLPPVAIDAANGFSHVVDHHVMAKLQFPELTTQAVHTGEQLTGPIIGGGKSSKIEIG